MKRRGLFTGMVTALAIVSGVLGGVLGGCSTLEGLFTAEEASAPTLMRSEPDIRVRVRKGSTTAKVDGSAKLVVRAANSGKVQLLSAPITLASSAGGLSITDAAGVRSDHGAGVDLEIIPWDRAGAPNGFDSAATIAAGGPDSARDARKSVIGALPKLRLDGVGYPGFLVVRPRSDEGADRFDVVAVMQMEEYLPGVVVKEMFPKWPQEAFAVQAVASRSYALHERERAHKLGRWFDVESTTADQVYGGAPSNAAAYEAVRQTRGQVVTYGGEIVRAYYSSTCGGRPASARDVFPTDSASSFNLAGPLQSTGREAFCESATYYRWDVVRSDDDVSRRLRAWGRTSGKSIADIRRVRAFSVKRTGDAGRPTRFVVTDDSNTSYEIAAEELRNALNTETEGAAPLTKQTRVYSGDMTIEVWADTVRIRGRGFGHGVGMCQWCAKGMVERGKKWQQCIRVFYPGCSIRRAY
ncbi:MAG: SpoIID/LytB domain-containing protein [Phycisphaerae bacterium]|nr:SpoIID/LytB domain-containing protein [Phycisphaerae bacterium]